MAFPRRFDRAGRVRTDKGHWRGAGFGTWLLAAAMAWLVLLAGSAQAADRAQLIADAENGYGRMILTFPDRLDLPAYKLKADNGVLSLTFDSPIDLYLPDIAAALPDYISVARIDPDHKGVRFGLRTSFTVNRMEAGEKLFIDLLPEGWQGLPPGLPPEVVANLAKRAKEAQRLAEQKTRAAEARRLNPKVDIQVGRNPTFVRLQFDWTIATKGSFAFDKGTGTLSFDWPVPVDIGPLKADRPAQLLGVSNTVTPDGTNIELHVADGVVPRFYAISDKKFIVDLDVPNSQAVGKTAQEILAERQKAIATAAAAVSKDDKAAPKAPNPDAAGNPDLAGGTDPHQAFQDAPQAAITPYASLVGQTLRLVFPFSQDTPAAVFRRGDTVWMLFDTLTLVHQPDRTEALSSVVKDFTSTPSGGTQVVRVDLSQARLATLGSEGRAWVLSIGDQMLTPTEPMTLTRRQDNNGLYQMTADISRPAKVHQFRDPVVGDLLTVVTAYPPARGLTRDLHYVDFEGLKSVHGLVIKPLSDSVAVNIEGKLAVISAVGGLALSAMDKAQAEDAVSPPESRAGYVDLASMHESDPVALTHRRDALMDAASRADQEARDKARLDLARFDVANRLGAEALGVLDVAKPDLKAGDLKQRAQRLTAIADVVMGRPKDALAILNTPGFADQADALMWRSIARTDNYDFRGARDDAAISKSVVQNYPQWVRTRFWLDAARSALETSDPQLAQSSLDNIDFAKLEGDDVTLYELLQGRVAEEQGRLSEALDTYGQVIAADVRPTRAEAVYRTLLILDRQGKLNLDKAVDTLGAEVMVWRGNPLEADMDKLLAELYFRKGDYRDGFETVKSAVESYPDSAPINALQQEARDQFVDLFLNGKADALDPVAALGIYYDFRALTPPGAQGDQMIRNLATRLVKLDLLDQAAQLLQYQVDNRLGGAARAQVAADLAVVLIADRRPQDALKVLHDTDLAELPPALQRQRRVLEARALIDRGRNELALDLMNEMSGRDVDLLRIDANWNAKNYDRAAELLEQLYAPGDSVDTLSQPGRMNILKAAVGYVLANDQIGTSRLRSKFADSMSKSAEWPMFDYLTSPIATPALQFKQAAHDIAAVDSLGAFLAAYNKVYSATGALTPLDAAKVSG